MFEYLRRAPKNLPHGAAEPFWTQEHKPVPPSELAARRTPEAVQAGVGEIALRVPTIFVANDVATPVTYH